MYIMPLIEEEPPGILPRGHLTARPSSPACGSVT
jgi:hypothetical protein